MNWLPIAQIFVSIVLIVLVLLQERSSGISGVLGGSGENSFYQTRRGLENIIFWSTIVFAVVFAALALIGLVL
ncbi:MAG: preprotein translocase subunit SecG [Patescibacteria group bacterium]|nr:preprotein translocase subunit SecG [Patescibacteria group bacterium]